jgi:PAS domain S-box-containing protein
MVGKLTRIMNLTEEEIIHHPALVVNVFDKQHRTLFWNKKCEQFFGIKEEEALGKRLEDLVPHVSGNPKMARLDDALSGKYVFISDEKYDNTDYHYTQVVLPLKNHKDEVVAAVNIVRLTPSDATTFENEVSKNTCVTVAG